ncbi:MAG: hypothetical protein ACRDCF_00175 [Mycoplasmoidaceae bacterium]
MQKKKRKNNLKYILIGLTGVLPLVTIPFLSFLPYNNNLVVNTVNTKSFKTSKEQVSPNKDGLGLAKDEFQNALYKDAYEKATYDPDSVLVYSIYWFSVFHRFGLVSHILSVLSINPEQKIYLMETSGINDYSPLLAIDEKTGERKYPNVEIIESAPGFDSTDGVWLLSNRFITPIDFFNEIYKKHTNDEGVPPRIHAYFADLTFYNVIKNFFEGSNIPLLKKNIYDFWGLFNKFESVNIFADGHDVYQFFDTVFYEFLTKAGIGEYTKYSDNEVYEFEYKEAANFRKEFLESQKKGEDFAHKFLEKNNAIMYIISLMITKDFSGDNKYPNYNGPEESHYPDSKFFFPTTEPIDDFNRGNSAFLQTNDDDYLNPYNSYEADLLESFKYLDEEKFGELSKILKASNILDDPTLSQGMNNKVNVVYSGTLLNNSNITPEELRNIRRGELNNLRAIDIITKRNNPGKDVQIIYKGHPRDKTPEAIIKAFEETRIDLGLKPEEVPELKVVDPIIPYELYLFSGIFDEDLSVGKEVKLYSNFSTIILFLYADGRVDDIINISVTEEKKKELEYIYGSESNMFNDKVEIDGQNKLISKFITTEELLEEAGLTK